MTSDKGSKTHSTVTGKGSALTRYMAVVAGKPSFLYLLYFEFCTWLSLVPGAVGLQLRKIFWRRLFAGCHKSVFFGHGIKLLHPNRIVLGKNVVISDNCVLDARSPEIDEAIVVGENAMIANGVIISCKGGKISIGENVGVGAYTVMQSTAGNPITIEADAIIGPCCYLTGGGNYNVERTDIPITRQGMRVMGGSVVHQGVWIGASANVLGGVQIGRDSIVGTGSTVTKPLPEYSINLGVPAKTVKSRK